MAAIDSELIDYPVELDREQCRIVLAATDLTASARNAVQDATPIPDSTRCRVDCSLEIAQELQRAFLSTSGDEHTLSVCRRAAEALKTAISGGV